MSILARLILIVLAATTTALAAPAMAGSGHGGVGGPPGQEALPPNAQPGQCYSRRVTGPGGAYRWDRVECDGAYGDPGYGYGYGGGLEVQTQGAAGYSSGYQSGYQGGYAVDCGCAGYGGYRYEAACDPCQGQGGGYQGGYAYGGGYAGDRYGERRYDSQSSQYKYEYGSRSYSGGYAYGRGGQGVNYPPPYGYGAPSYGYGAAGRDQAGYLIWPGKTP